MKQTKALIQTEPEILGGALVFSGTRVPVQALFDYLIGGQPLTEFLEDFPTVEREQAVEVLRLAVEELASNARSA